jgi:hypothetical protein
MEANATATIYNPFNFAINITYLEYDIYFDDADGVFPVYAPKNDIFINKTIKDYSLSPIELNSKIQYDMDVLISSSTPELVARLLDEYVKTNLKIDIKNGIMRGEIGEFTFEIEFSFSDIPV